jgi:NADH:ubiquinone oxidoreductase subunit E/NAD-dependent dihydropyrimidine dehydrogenase PreA subunit
MLGMMKALRTTISHLPRRKITVQYPEERPPLPERSRGLFSVVVNPATADPRCRACTLCETNCPVQVIRVNYENRYRLPAVNEARIGTARIAVQTTFDMGVVDRIIDEYLDHALGFIGVLQEIQDSFQYLPRLALERVALRTGLSLSHIYGVASFYNQFRLSPVGKYVISVCLGTACHVAGAPLIVEALRQELDIAVGETTPDGLFTLQTVNCVGACALAPVVRVGDDDTHGRVTPDDARTVVRTLRHEEEQ